MSGNRHLGFESRSLRLEPPCETSGAPGFAGVLNCARGEAWESIVRALGCDAVPPTENRRAPCAGVYRAATSRRVPAASSRIPRPAIAVVSAPTVNYRASSRLFWSLRWEHCKLGRTISYWGLPFAVRAARTFGARTSTVGNGRIRPLLGSVRCAGSSARHARPSAQRDPRLERRSDVTVIFWHRMLLWSRPIAGRVDQPCDRRGNCGKTCVTVSVG